MTYKLVPINPTPEMIHAGQMAVSGFPRDVLERWEAMLAAAPDLDRQVIAELNEDDDGYWADILPDVSHIVKLLVAARSSVDYQMSAQNQNHEAGRKHHAHFQSLLGEIDAVIATYRKQGGSK